MLLGAEISGAEPLKIHVIECKKIQRRPPRKPCKCAVFYTTGVDRLMNYFEAPAETSNKISEL